MCEKKFDNKMPFNAVKCKKKSLISTERVVTKLNLKMLCYIVGDTHLSYLKRD